MKKHNCFGLIVAIVVAALVAVLCVGCGNAKGDNSVSSASFSVSGGTGNSSSSAEVGSSESSGGGSQNSSSSGLKNGGIYEAH